MKHETFIEEYAQALDSETAGLFVGAGISMSAGYPSWKTLVREMAEEVKLDPEQENDLPGLVQYFLNSQKRQRTRLASIIQREVDVEKPIPPILNMLARLPIKDIWTTNYDTLIERAWRGQQLLLDVKTDKEDLVLEKPRAHGRLFKMHGTATSPSEVVIAKGDYEGYRRDRGPFLDLLRSHLLSKRMLFLGFSFTDPNLSHVFTLIREEFGDMPPQSYAVVRRPVRGDFAGRGAKARFEYAHNRHDLWVSDLENYGIKCVQVDDWAELDQLIARVERRLRGRSVLVSGSYPDTHGASDERKKVEAVATEVGRLLAQRDYRIVSGFGLVVGSAVLSGAVGELYRETAPNLDRQLFLRPFPQAIPENEKREVFYRRYREDLVRQAGIGIFISGVKADGTADQPAEGVLTEYEIMKDFGRVPIPIGATGGGARLVWDRVNAEYGDIYGNMPRAPFERLNDPRASVAEIVGAVERILDNLKRP